MKTTNYITVFKDGRIHSYSERSDRAFLKFIKEVETEIIFKIEDDSEKAIQKSEEITNFCLEFVAGRIDKEVLVGLFNKFLFDKDQKEGFSLLGFFIKFFEFKRSY